MTQRRRVGRMDERERKARLRRRWRVVASGDSRTASGSGGLLVLGEPLVLGEEVGVGGGDGFAQGREEGGFEVGCLLVGLVHVGVVVDEDLELEKPAQVDYIVDVDADRVIEIELAGLFDFEPDRQRGLPEALLDLGVGVEVVVRDFGIGAIFAFVEDVFDGLGRADRSVNRDRNAFFESPARDIVIGVGLAELDDLRRADFLTDQAGEVGIAELGFEFEVLHCPLHRLYSPDFVDRIEDLAGFGFVPDFDAQGLGLGEL